MPLASPRLFVRTLPPDGHARRMFEPLSLPIYVLLAAAAAAAAIGVWTTEFGADPDLTQPLLSLVMLCLSGLGLRRFGLAALGEMIQAVTLLSAISVAGAFGSLLLAATAAPFVDEWLIGRDAALFFGFHWLSTMRAIASWAASERILFGASHVYSTLSWQPMFLVVLLFAWGRERHGWNFLTAWGLTLAATVLVFPFFPAVGAYLHHGVAPGEIAGVSVPAAWRHVEILYPIRDGSLRLLSARTLEGVVTFPSFHAAAAVLLAWGFWPLRLLRWPFFLLNVAMFASSLAIGGHYLIDLAAGGVIAICAIGASIALSRRIVAGRRGAHASAPDSAAALAPALAS